MIVKPALAALLASGFIVPEAPKLVVPTPAVVRAEHLELTRHILLGMPTTMGMLKRRSSAVSYVNSTALFPANSITIPAHQVGDLIIIFAPRNSTAVATIPATFTTLYNTANANGSSFSLAIGYRIATVTNTASGTWTNASSLGCIIFRGASGIGAFNVRQSVTSGSTSCVWNALTLTNNSSNTSWICGFATLYNTASGTPNAPTGRTSRLNSNYHRFWDTNGAFSGSSYTSQTSTMASQRYNSSVLEIVSA
jgi:hypothetical protein